MTTTYVLDDVSELQDVYDALAEDINGIDYTDWMARELDELAKLHKGYFDRSSSPEGAPWQANAPSTIAAKGHSTVLRGVRTRRAPKRKGVKLAKGRWISGYRLATSLTTQARQTTGDAIREGIQTDTAAWLKFGTAVEYAGYNDQGTSRIPARPMVGLNEANLDKMVERVADYVIDQLK